MNVNAHELQKVQENLLNQVELGYIKTQVNKFRKSRGDRKSRIIW